jgi:type II restriction enzyme
MKMAILEDRRPNLYVLHYDPARWKVRTLLLIPRFALGVSALECRKPLKPTARRAGWVGCNILLDVIPADARIPIIVNDRVVPHSTVRRNYERLRPLQNLGVEARGWTLDVLQTVRSLNKRTFTLSDVYAHANRLSNLHPRNLHIRDKIRQQLQVLRDLGFIQFVERGSYLLR